jgi:hypothetical protein
MLHPTFWAFSKTCGHALTGNRDAKSRDFLHAQTLRGASEWNPANCRGSGRFEGSRACAVNKRLSKEQGKSTSDLAGRTSAAVLLGTEYRARNRFNILARGPLVFAPCREPRSEASARLSGPHLIFPNIPPPAPVAQSCLAAVGPAAPGAHPSAASAASAAPAACRAFAFWTLLFSGERIDESVDLSAADLSRPDLPRFLVTSWTGLCRPSV